MFARYETNSSESTILILFFLVRKLRALTVLMKLALMSQVSGEIKVFFMEFFQDKIIYKCFPGGHSCA